MDGYRDRPDGGRTRCTGRYFRTHRLLCISLGRFVALGEGTVGLYAVLGLTALLIVLIIVFFNHFEKTWIGKLFTLGQRSTTKAGYVSNDVLEDLAGKEG